MFKVQQLWEKFKSVSLAINFRDLIQGQQLSEFGSKCTSIFASNAVDNGPALNPNFLSSIKCRNRCVDFESKDFVYLEMNLAQPL